MAVPDFETLKDHFRDHEIKPAHFEAAKEAIRALDADDAEREITLYDEETSTAAELAERWDLEDFIDEPEGGFI